MAARTLVLSENQLLSQGIKSWVVGNGYKLYWNSKKDYLIYNTISLSGRTDDEILQALGDLFASENYGLVVKKYEKNHVIVIDEM
ncbi:pilus assembly protein [Salmonella enterica]|nr:pilus assembly protein [Salmonella enterica]